MTNKKQNIVYGLLLAGVVLIGYQGYANSRKIESLTVETSRIADAEQAQRETRKFLVDGGFRRAQHFCADASRAARTKLCSVLVLKSFERLGSHDDLWVTLDAITLFADNLSLPKETRRQVTKYYADLSASLNQDGALDFILRDSDDKSAVYANDIYAAILSQAVVCDTLPRYRTCSGGLTKEARLALRGLIELVLTNGEKMSPYEMSNRMESVRRLSDSGAI